jgi:hypothetical protein
MAAEVALISGHNDMRMLFRYTHPLRASIAEKLDQHLLDINLEQVGAPVSSPNVGVATVGEIRRDVVKLQDLGKGSVAHLRETLGPSTDGIRPLGKKPA